MENGCYSYRLTKGITEFLIRIMCWLYMRNDDYRNSQMVVVTGPNQDLAVKIIKRMKGLFEPHGITFDSSMTVLNLNGCEIQAYPSNHIDAFRSLTKADVSIPWEKITRGLPRGRRYSDDRAPTIEEIRKLCEYPDRRIKPLVYSMVSSGIRVGAWDYLHWGNIRPIEQDGKIVSARMLVYADEEDSYISYITPSAYRELAEWMKYREKSGELITDDSWVMRDLWDTQIKLREK